MSSFILVQEIGINRVSPADLKIARGQSWLGSALEHLRGRCCLVRVFQCSIQFELWDWGRPIVQFITSARVAWRCQASCSSTFESVAPLWVLTTRLLVSPAFAAAMILERLKPGLGIRCSSRWHILWVLKLTIHPCACSNHYSHVVNTYLFGLVSFQFITYYTSGGSYSRVVLILWFKYTLWQDIRTRCGSGE